MSPGSPKNGAEDEFDAILSPTASVPAPSARSRAALEASGHYHHAGGAAELHEAPSLQDFVAGWELYRDPVLAGVLAGATLAALGVFVLLRRAVFVTAAVSQAAGLGVALAFFAEIQFGIHVSPVFGALALAVSCTLAVVARTPRRFSRETLVGLFFVGASALAVLIGDRIAQEAHDVAAILFGTAVLVRPVDLLLLAIGSALAATALLFLQRALTFTGMDPDGARVQGLPVSAIETVFWSVLALEVSFATRALGSLPVFAFAVLPSAAGLLLADRVVTALVYATLVGASAGGLGYLTAFLGDLPVGASQASVAMALTLVAYGVSRVVRRNS